MPKREPEVQARFTTHTNHRHHTLLQDTPPQLISALHSIYPLLIISNRILSTITWTGDSSYRNFVLISLVSFIVLHWNNYLATLIPFFIVLSFCCYAWFIKVSIVDTTIRNEIPPTLDEILDTLDNFNKRFTFFLDLSPSPKTYFDIFTNLCLLTPFYAIIMKNFVSVNTWLVAAFVYIFTYYSTWCIAIRKLLWRSKSVRGLLEFITGEKYSKVDKDLEISILNMNTRGSLNENTKIIEFHLTENERRWLGLGWTKKMLFYEKRAPYYYRESKQSLTELKQFQFPNLKNYPQSEWKWVDTKWTPRTNWIYCDNYWKSMGPNDAVSSFTRSRELKRQCIVALKK